METIKRRILLENFINRADSKFIAIDGTNMNEPQDKRENIWGKIPMNIKLRPDNNLMKIGLEWEYLGDDYVHETEDIDEKSDNYLTIGNIGKIYKEVVETTDEEGNTTEETKYYQVVYTDVLAFKEFEDENKNIIFSTLQYNTLLKYYRFLKYLRLNVTLYHKCNDRFFEIYDKPYSTPEDDGTIYDAFYAYFLTNENGAIIINSNEDIRIELNEDGIEQSGEYATLFDDIGFYGEVPTDIEKAEDVICVTRTEYADLFNSLFRRNKMHRYECLLWELAEDVLKGDNSIECIEPTLDIPLYIEADINSMGLFNTINDEKYNVNGNCDECTTYRGEEDSNITSTNNAPYKVNALKYSELRRNLQRQLSESEDGETLPFVIKERVDSKIVNITSEVPYLLGITNIIKNTKNDITYNTTDVLNRITFTDVDDNTNEWVYVIEDGKVKKNGEEIERDYITADELVKIGDDYQVHGMKGEVEFEYTLNANVDGDNKVINNTGVKHIEKYNFETKLSQQINYKLSEEEKNGITYSDNLKGMLSVVDVEYEEDEEDPLLTYDEVKHKKFENIGNVYRTVVTDEYGNENIVYKQIVLLMDYVEIDYDHNADGSIDDVPMVDIEYYANDIDNRSIFEYNYLYKPNFLDDIEFINEKIIDGDLVGRINVERSKSAAFERHNILCEVNTMQDLENYRNDLFKIRN